MLELLVDYYQQVKMIFLYFIVAIIIFLYLMKNKFRTYVLYNRAELLKNPLLVPIVTMYDENKESPMTMFRAIIQIIWTVTKDAFEILMKPMYMIVDSLLAVLKTIQSIVNSVRKQLSAIRNMLLKIFEDMYSRLDTSIATMNFLFLKLREVMKRTYGMTSLMMYTVQHSIIFLETLIGSPIGGIAKMLGDSGVYVSIFGLGVGGIPAWTDSSLCFEPETQLEIAEKGTISIKDVLLEDHIIDSSDNKHKIVGKIVIDAKEPLLYDVSGVHVTGDHVIDINGRGIRVKEYVSMTKMSKRDCNTLICLITNTGFIPMPNNLIFRDYLDVHNVETHRVVRNMCKHYFNNTDIECHSETSIKEGECLDMMSAILLDMNTSIINTDEIVGNVEVGIGQLNMYKLNGMGESLYSGNTWVLYMSKWICIWEHPEAIYVGKNDLPIEHWITKHNKVYLSNGLCIRDFVEVSNRSFIEKMNKFLLNNSSK